MGYSAFADVVSEFKKIDFSSANALVPAASVDIFCAQADSYINAQLSTRYVVPIVSTDSGDNALLKMMSVTLAASRIRKILETKQATATNQNQNVLGSDGFSVKDVKEMIQQLKDGTMLLSGATFLTPAGLISTSDESNPTFHVGRNEW